MLLAILLDEFMISYIMQFLNLFKDFDIVFLQSWIRNIAIVMILMFIFSKLKRKK
jgi:hypothetical protein